MKKIFIKIFRYELLNVLRNRWVFAYAIFLMLINFIFLRISGNSSKAVLGLSSVCSVLVPLITILFGTVYGYYTESFLSLLLSQPLNRLEVWLARNLAIIVSLSLSFLIGLILPTAIWGAYTGGFWLLCLTGVLLTTVFSLIASFVVTRFQDRMIGVGVAFFVWFYAAVIHDGILLIILTIFKEYPLESFSGFFGCFNPVGLVRVGLIVFHDASMLLGISGVMMRRVVTEPFFGLTIVGSISLFWILVPAYTSLICFKRKNF